MRIVGGSLRGRPLSGPRSAAIRPTSDRLRETIFDILVHRFADPVDGARVMDLFAGTGALGLEALSRGAAEVLFVDNSAAGRALVRANAEALGVVGRIKVFRRDAARLGPAGTVKPFSLVFADPPYGAGLGAAALAAAAGGGWLAPGALAVLEESAAADVAVPLGFELVHRRRVGTSGILFLRFGGEP